MPPSLSPQQFVATWRAAALKESAAYQAHFIDLCRLVGHGAPAEVDPQGRFFVFQAGAAVELVQKRDTWLQAEAGAC